MKRVAVIFLALLYITSTSGVALSNFYCCGKWKETFLFSHHDYGKDCKQNKKVPGCCDTKTILVKVNDSHSGSQQVKVNDNNFSKQMFTVAHTIIQPFLSSDDSHSFAFVHVPPLISKQPVYLSVCNFRI